MDKEVDSEVFFQVGSIVSGLKWATWSSGNVGRSDGVVLKGPIRGGAIQVGRSEGAEQRGVVPRGPIRWGADPRGAEPRGAEPRRPGRVGGAEGAESTGTSRVDRGVPRRSGNVGRFEGIVPRGRSKGSRSEVASLRGPIQEGLIRVSELHGA